MKKVLFAAKDCGNPIQSGYDKAAWWIADQRAKGNMLEGCYITSHKIGTWTNRYNEQEEVYAYEVCIDEE